MLAGLVSTEVVSMDSTSFNTAILFTISGHHEGITAINKKNVKSPTIAI
jgi:hypothetical protein